ncbi:hypothetical protein L3Y34_015877 [Caenorhabditis briggsae]|uniref:Uncharacterized protein n=1 Tax=Caenorhabditis briggsae TaxID=6238 RepID=A0AAE9DW54_CAEBR|nr:hypothetical protein L3Y34_015877 [Caenorhabditis briggsae]
MPALPDICFSILLDILVIYYIYCDELFTDKTISFIFFPKAVAPKMFIYFCVMGILNLINFLFSMYQHRKNNQIRNSKNYLSSKYQLEEVYESTKFSVSVISCHFLLFSLYIVGIGILRYFGSKIIPDSIDLMACRGAFTTMISFNNLVVGVIAVCLNRKMKQRKRNSIKRTVRIKTTGNVGAQNYENQIFRIWNSTLKMH